jgi:ABC-2 type transport system ATP-binding protein
LISLEGINKSYKKKVLNGINLKADKGKCVGILGSNGCGKTTLLGIMAGVIKYDSGRIFYDGQCISGKKLFYKYVGYVPQENPLIDEVSARDNIKLWYGNKFDDSILEKLGINEFIDKRISELSGGMKRRVSICIAMMKRPKILILDEPSAALDIYGKKEVVSHIKEFIAEGGTAVISTHDRDEIEICDKIYLMKEGVLTEKGDLLSFYLK